MEYLILVIALFIGLTLLCFYLDLKDGSPEKTKYPRDSKLNPDYRDKDGFKPHYEDSSYEAKCRRIGHYGISTTSKSSMD